MLISLANLIWIIDGILGFFAAGFALFVIAEAGISRRRQVRHRLGLDYIQGRLHALNSSAGGKIAGDAEAYLRKLTLEQWLEIVHHPEDFIPPEQDENVRKFLRESPFAEQAVKTAKSRGPKWQRVDALLLIGYARIPGSFEILKKGLLHHDADIRYYAILGLARLGTLPAVTQLLEMLETSSYSGQQILSLIDRLPVLSVETLIFLAQNRRERTRYWSLKLLTRLPRPNNIKAIIALTEDPSADVRAAACECLGTWIAAEAENSLRKCLKDELWFVRMRAVRALGAILKETAIPLMIDTVCSDDNEYVKESAKSVISRDIYKALPYMERCLVQGDADAKRHCINSLVETNQILPILLNVAGTPEEKETPEKAIFRYLVVSGIYFGLKYAMKGFSAPARRKIINEIKKWNPPLALEASGWSPP